MWHSPARSTLSSPHRAPRQSWVVWIVESLPLPVTDYLELVLDPRSPLDLDGQEPDVSSRDQPELEIIRPEIDAMAEIDRVRRSARCKCAEVALDHRKA